MPLGSTLPNQTPSLSYWQRTTRSFAHLHANNIIPVPTSAKYVVIGSGIAGALTAFELLEAGINAQEVVILEAREAAGGASSRNAGHVRPGMYSSFTSKDRWLIGAGDGDDDGRCIPGLYGVFHSPWC